MNYSAIVLAAGRGKRMNLGYNKMFLELDHKPLFILSILKFVQDPNCNQILLMINKDDANNIKRILEEYNLNDYCTLVFGGEERQESVYNGLNFVKNEIVLVHDGARPFFTQDLLTTLVEEANKFDCAIPAVKVKDTIKLVKDNFIEETLPRQYLYAVQTPQACRTSSLLYAHNKAMSENYLGTDEASLIEKYCDTKVKIVFSSYENIKITTTDDLVYAKNLYPKYYK